MTDITPTAWFIKIAHDRGIKCTDYDGFPELRHAVLEDTSERIADEYDRQDDWTLAFNNETMEWPHIARAYVAAYEARFTDRSEEYLDNCRDFAESMDVMGYDIQSNLGWFEEHGTDMDDLPEENVELALMLSANDDDIGIAREVENVSEFLNWYQDGTDASRAKTLAEFDGNIRPFMADVVAPRDAWDTIDPSNIPQETCLMCGDTFNKIHHRTQGVVWVRQHPDADIVSLHETGDEFFANRPGRFCGTCADRLREDNPQVAVVTDSGQYRIRSNGRVLADEADGAFDSIDNDNDASLIRADTDRVMVNRNDVVSLSAQDHPRAETASGDVTEAEQTLLEDAFENPRRFFTEEGIFIVNYESRGRYDLRVLQENTEALRDAKQVLDNVIIA